MKDDEARGVEDLKITHLGNCIFGLLQDKNKDIADVGERLVEICYACACAAGLYEDLGSIKLEDMRTDVEKLRYIQFAMNKLSELGKKDYMNLAISILYLMNTLEDLEGQAYFNHRDVVEIFRSGLWRIKEVCSDFDKVSEADITKVLQMETRRFIWRAEGERRDRINMQISCASAKIKEYAKNVEAAYSSLHVPSIRAVVNETFNKLLDGLRSLVRAMIHILHAEDIVERRKRHMVQLIGKLRSLEEKLQQAKQQSDQKALKAVESACAEVVRCYEWMMYESRLTDGFQHNVNLAKSLINIFRDVPIAAYRRCCEYINNKVPPQSLEEFVQGIRRIAEQCSIDVISQIDNSTNYRAQLIDKLRSLEEKLQQAKQSCDPNALEAAEAARTEVVSCYEGIIKECELRGAPTTSYRIHYWAINKEISPQDLEGFAQCVKRIAEQCPMDVMSQINLDIIKKDGFVTALNEKLKAIKGGRSSR